MRRLSRFVMVVVGVLLLLTNHTRVEAQGCDGQYWGGQCCLLYGQPTNDECFACTVSACYAPGRCPTDQAAADCAFQGYYACIGRSCI